MNQKVALTGIKPTGEPHLGNYLGAIKPALALTASYDARYFVADYHALNTIKDANTLRQYTLDIASCWLACGLNPQKTLFYRQSDVPETFELAVLLAPFTAKGLMNRAHAYKAAVERNLEAGSPPDHALNMGLYTYPMLMAADILLFDTDVVPVGADQKQHVEMTQDIAGMVNNAYKEALFVIPQPLISEGATVVGLDGRKMGKAYDNTIPLFCEEKKLKKLINSIVTNSQSPEEPKDPELCSIFSLYKNFATPARADALAARYRAGGMGWGEAKAALFDLINTELAPMRVRYNEYRADADSVMRMLKEGSLRAREIASQKISSIRRAFGID